METSENALFWKRPRTLKKRWHQSVDTLKKEYVLIGENEDFSSLFIVVVWIGKNHRNTIELMKYILFRFYRDEIGEFWKRISVNEAL